MSADNGRDTDHQAGEWIDMMGSRFELVARLGAAESDAVLFRMRMAPDQLVPLHSHIDPECFYVLTGTLEVFVDDAQPGWRHVSAGRSLVVADGVRHAVRNPAAEPADLILATNNRLARFFRDAGRPVTDGAAFTPPGAREIEKLVQTAHAFGYWLASPAESAAITGTGAA